MIKLYLRMIRDNVGKCDGCDSRIGVYDVEGMRGTKQLFRLALCSNCREKLVNDLQDTIG